MNKWDKYSWRIWNWILIFASSLAFSQSRKLKLKKTTSSLLFSYFTLQCREKGTRNHDVCLKLAIVLVWSHVLVHVWESVLSHLFFFLLLFKYICLHFYPTTPPCPMDPHLPPLALSMCPLYMLLVGPSPIIPTCIRKHMVTPFWGRERAEHCSFSYTQMTHMKSPYLRPFSAMGHSKKG